MSTIGRFQVLALITLGVLAASSVSAQQRRGGFSVGVSALGVAANEAVQKELGLNAEVTGKIAALYEEHGAATQKAYQEAGIEFGNLQNLSDEERQQRTAKIATVNAKLRDEFNPKVKALVSADQYKRVTEILLQSNLSTQGPAALTAAAVATELKITDEQKKRLTDLRTEYAAKQRELFAGGAPDQDALAKLREERTAKTVEVLTAEQKTKLETLKGKAFDVSQIGFGGPGRGRRGGGN